MATDNKELAAKIADRGGKMTPMAIDHKFKVWWKNENGAKLSKLLGNEAKARRLMTAVLTSISKNPRLMECTFDSLQLCVLQSAEMDLIPGALQECAYVPFWSSKLNAFEAVFMPMYQGLVKLCYQTEYIKTIEANVVYESDEFEFEFGTDKFLRHRPAFGSDRGDIIATYAIARMKSDEFEFVVLSRDEIESIKKRSRAATSEKQDSPWKHEDTYDYDEMAKKTAIRRLAKILPKSPQLGDALEANNRAERPDLITVTNVPINTKIIEESEMQKTNTLTEIEKQEILNAEAEEIKKSAK